MAAGIVAQTTADLNGSSSPTLAVNVLMLMLFLRASSAPVCLLVLNVLALGATLGLMHLLFDGVLHHDGLTFYVPFAVAVLLWRSDPTTTFSPSAGCGTKPGGGRCARPWSP